MESRDQRRDLERTPRLIRGGRALLFERLSTTSAPGPFSRKSGEFNSRVQEAQDLSESVLRELRRLLNTRLPGAAGTTDETQQTVLNYGLPDFSLLNSASPQDRDILARLLERKIAGFEPRLSQVRVSLEPHPTERNAVIGTMYAHLRTRLLSEPVAFPLKLGRDGVELVSETTPAPQAVQS